LVGDLKLENNKHYLYLRSILINSTENSIDTYFAVKMQKQELTGKVYGSMDDPKVNLRLQKYIKHQMSQQMDRVMGKEATRVIRQIPMEGMAEGMAAGATASFIKVFF